MSADLLEGEVGAVPPAVDDVVDAAMLTIMFAGKLKIPAGNSCKDLTDWLRCVVLIVEFVVVVAVLTAVAGTAKRLTAAPNAGS